MSRIRGRDTRPELRIRKALHAAGFRYRVHQKNLPGTPDIVLPRFQAVIHVHGCFWHGHDCSLFKLPKTNTEFWRNKIASNQARDQEVAIALRDRDWRSATVWECSIKGRQRVNFDNLIEDVCEWLLNGEGDLEVHGI